MKNRLSELDERLDQVAYAKANNLQGWLKFQRKYEMCWIYHENLLDGVSMSPEEVMAALSNEAITDVSQVSLFRRVRNYHAAINLIRERAAAPHFVVDVPFFRELHAVLANGLDTNLGRFRRNSPVHRAYYQDICAPSKVEKHLQDIVALVMSEEKRPTMHPVELAGRVHHQFMIAYPFSSWSGIVGRFFVNMLLMHSGRLPVVIHNHDRQRYYQAVATSPILVTRVLADAYENTLDNAYHHFVEPQEQKERSGVSKVA